MKTIIPILFIIFVLAGCRGNNEEYYSQSPREIVKTLENYYQNYNEVNLNRKFIPLDSSGKQIKKLEYVKMIANGDYYSVRMKDRDHVPVYRLYAFQTSDNPEIVHINRQFGLLLYENVIKEGKQILNFNLPDLNGKMINLEKLRGQVVVLKFWFISCHACIEEFPLVNSIVAKYPKFRFISLASDSKEKVAAFLKEHTLAYQVIADSKTYEDKLDLGAWPTHIVIDRKGRIVKYVNDANDLFETLDALQ